MKRDFNNSQLAATIKWWLNYISSVGRNYILSEGSIKFPFAEYLERSNVKDIKFEYSHPCFLKKRIDLAFSDNKTNSNQEYAYEFKYIKDASTKDPEEKQRIFDDLMRLFFYAESNSSRKGFFLICGAQDEFVANFQRIRRYQAATRIRADFLSSVKFSSAGFYTEWFSFDTSNPEKRIDLTTTKQEYSAIYSSFLKDYSSSYNEKMKASLQMPSEIVTRLVYLSEQIGGDDTIYFPSQIGIWEIIKPNV